MHLYVTYQKFYSNATIFYEYEGYIYEFTVIQMHSLWSFHSIPFYIAIDVGVNIVIQS